MPDTSHPVATVNRFWRWLASMFRKGPIVYDVVLEEAGSWVHYKREVLLSGVDLGSAATFLRETVVWDQFDSIEGTLPGQIYVDHIDNVRDRFARTDFLGGWVEYCSIFAIPTGAGDESREYTHEADPNSLNSCVWLPIGCQCVKCRAFFEDSVG